MSEKFARTLVEVLIDNAFPARDLSRPEFVSFPDVVQMFFENAAMVRQAADETGNAWCPEAVAEADDWLTSLAEDGTFDGIISMPEGVAEEIWRRWRYVIVAAQLEADHGKLRPALTLPSNIPDSLKGVAAMVYFLAGEGRNYQNL
jgi:hypothetical protein